MTTRYHICPKCDTINRDYDKKELKENVIKKGDVKEDDEKSS